MRWVVCFSVLCSHLGHFLGFASLINIYGRLLLDLRLPSHAPYPAPTYLPHLVYLPSSLCLLFESRAVQRKKKRPSRVPCIPVGYAPNILDQLRL